MRPKSSSQACAKIDDSAAFEASQATCTLCHEAPSVSCCCARILALLPLAASQAGLLHFFFNMMCVS